jgi:hypothetical protein
MSAHAHEWGIMRENKYGQQEVSCVHCGWTTTVRGVSSLLYWPLFKFAEALRS